MSTLDGHHNSDSEDDLDYVPEGEEQDSDSSASEKRDPKRARVQSPSPTREDLATAKSERQVLWTKFQESVKTPSTGASVEPEKRMVKIVKRHRFAGEDVVEIVDVPEDSADAKKWPLWKPPEGQNEAAGPRGSGSDKPTPSTVESPPAAAAAAAAVAAVAPAASSSSSSSVPPAQAQPSTTKRPIRRKPKLQLAELPSAGGAQKGKKLTTLEKSALDWKAHVDKPELASELEANRRGGGYLEKVEFLQRVGDRKGQAFEANKEHKRRRG